MLCFLNGTLLPLSEARVPVTDRGFLYGDSLFETLRVHAGSAQFLQQHLDRLELGMEVLGFDERPARAVLIAACEQVLAANAMREGVLRLAVTRGTGARGASPAGARSPTVLVTVSSLPADLAQRAARGYRVMISPWRKPPPDALPNQVKTGNYLNSILAMQHAVRAGMDEALLLDQTGCLAECSQGNVFLVSEGVLHTPSLESGALQGITRSRVLELARHLGTHVEETKLPAAMLGSSQEAFITNSVLGIMPIVEIDAWRFAVPGPITAAVLEAWSRQQ